MDTTWLCELVVGKGRHGRVVVAVECRIEHHVGQAGRRITRPEPHLDALDTHLGVDARQRRRHAELARAGPLRASHQSDRRYLNRR